MKVLISAKNLLAVVLLLVAAIPRISFSAESILVEEFDFSAAQGNPGQLANNYLNERISGNPLFKERKKIVPVYFSVTFQEVAETLVRGRGLLGALSGGEAKDSVWVAMLKGFTPEIRQKITDDLFADFVSDLTGRGFNVITPDQMATSETFQRVLKESKNNLDGTTQIKSEKDRHVYWQLVPRGMLFPETGFSAPITTAANVSKLMVDMGKASALMVSIAINVVKLTGVGSADGARSANNDTVFGLAIPVSTIEGKLGFSMQMISYNDEFEQQYGEKHSWVYNTQYKNMLHYNVSRALETAAIPIGEGKFVKDNKVAGALSLGLAVLGVSSMATPRIEYDVAVEPNQYLDSARKLVGAVRSMAFERAKQKYF